MRLPFGGGSCIANSTPCHVRWALPTFRCRCISTAAGSPSAAPLAASPAGYLLATLVPRLVYVWFPKGSFNDRRGGASYATGEPLDGATLLAAHRVPYVCWGKLLDVARAWSNPNVTFGSRKRSLPPSVHMWHNQSQMELQLPPPPFERIHLLSCNESTATGFKLGDASCDAEAASDDSWRRIRR